MIFVLPENSRPLTPNDDHRCHGPGCRRWWSNAQGHYCCRDRPRRCPTTGPGRDRTRAWSERSAGLGGLLLVIGLGRDGRARGGRRAQRYVFGCAGCWCAGECEPVRAKFEPGDPGVGPASCSMKIASRPAFDYTMRPSRALPTEGRHGRPACPARRFEHHHEVFMRDERSPARGLPRETVTIADLAVRLGLTLEDTYEVCRAHGVRAARPTTRISRDDADRLRRARFGHLERRVGHLRHGVARGPHDRRLRQTLGEPTRRRQAVHQPSRSRPRREARSPTRAPRAPQTSRRFRTSSHRSSGPGQIPALRRLTSRSWPCPPWHGSSRCPSGRSSVTSRTPTGYSLGCSSNCRPLTRCVGQGRVPRTRQVRGPIGSIRSSRTSSRPGPGRAA